MKKIITIIPAYNEQDTIKWAIDGAKTYSDVILINDGSDDQTAIISQEAGAKVVNHSKNRGKGAAIKTGLKTALKFDYDVLILMDGDGQHDPEYIPLLARDIGEIGIVIGSRFIGQSPPGMPLQRRLSNKLTTKLIDLVTGYHITDSQSGFRALSPDSARFFLEVSYDDYVFESEVLYQASLRGILIKEESVSCSYQDEKSYITLKNIIHYLFYIIQLFARKIMDRIKY
jgi:glycosyltransferase involved in cell wall biosynthesis